jgi:hypothetical protein
MFAVSFFTNRILYMLVTVSLSVMYVSYGSVGT